MGLAAGAKLGPYEIVAPLGAGGMGEVYRARDTRLQREVAIKILPTHLSQNPALKERFEREARAISQLSHPHICVLHDIGRQDETDYLVLEYLEGETLGARVRKGALPVDQVLKYGAQIADALDKAHRCGVVHRDLKPDNVMLTKAGVKLLDFGLVKPMAAASSLSSSLVATMSAIPLTSEGMLVGTFQYIAPEQLEGKEADARSDIFSLGCVLYEMATGKRAFEGKSPASVVGAIMNTEPAPLKDAAPLTPSALEWITRKCLAKDPEERWQSASDIAGALRWIEGAGAGVTAEGPAGSQARNFPAWIVAASALVIAAIAVALLADGYWRRPATEASVRASILPPENVSFLAGFSAATGFSISPDGTRLAYAAQSFDGKTGLWVRPLGSLNAQLLANTERAALPFWSPDGQNIGFFADGKVRRIPASGGTVQALADAPLGRGGSWNSQGDIIFSPSVGSTIVHISANGGVPVPVSQLDASRGETTHRWPQFLPDGNHFLYVGRSLANVRAGQIYVGSLAGGPGKPVMELSTGALYAPPGYLLFVRGGNLLAQKFDLKSLTVQGDELPVAEGVFVQPAILRASFDVSPTGLVVYHGSRQGDDTELIITDRSGKQTSQLAGSGNFSDVKISPDGKKIAVIDADFLRGDSNVWMYDVERNVRSRFTFAAGTSTHPVWSPDGSKLAFASNRSMAMNIYVKPTTGAGEEKLMIPSTEDERPQAFSPDSKYLVIERRLAANLGVPQIGVLPLTGEPRRFAFLQGNFWSYGGQISPDGRWMAYVSHESGRPEVYVASFPDGKAKWQVSSSGANSPQWRRDGKELFFCQSDGMLMAAKVSSTKDAFTVEAVTSLFQSRMLQGTFYWPFDVFPDGQHFVMAAVRQETVHMPLTLITNWPEALPK